jgi:hypothetical protein
MKNTHTTIEMLLETKFSDRSAQNGYKEDNSGAAHGQDIIRQT